MTAFKAKLVELMIDAAKAQGVTEGMSEMMSDLKM